VWVWNKLIEVQAFHKVGVGICFLQNSAVKAEKGAAGFCLNTAAKYFVDKFVWSDLGSYCL